VPDVGEDDGRALLEELWATPVGRRWILKAGLGSAVALGLGSQLAPVAEATRGKARNASSEQVHLHFALGHLRGVSHLTLRGNGLRLPLERHTKESRRALGREGGLWAKADLGVLSHHVSSAELPGHRAVVLSVHGRVRGKEVVVAQYTHVPEATVRELARASRRVHGSLEAVVSPARLRKLGLRPRDVTSPRHVAQLATVSDETSTAATVVAVHPDIATVDPASSALTQSLLQRSHPVVDLGLEIDSIQGPGGHYQTNDPVMADGEQVQILLGPDPATDSRGLTVYTFSTDPTFQGKLASALHAGITLTRNTAALGAVLDEPLSKSPSAATATWKQPQGVLPQSTPATGAPQASGIDITVRNPGVVSGTQIVPTGTYSQGQVPVEIYNNWVRWMWVYVQYLGANNENLSVNANPTWPDTANCKSVGVLSEVSTILGIPLWGTNYLQVTLDYPEGAHTARILLCGLGNDAKGGGWRQYFPDNAYPADRIAPAECTCAALITGIVTIGVTAFCLAMDIDGALIEDEIEPAVKTLMEQFGSAIVDATLYLGIPVAEAVAIDVASGTADRQANSLNIFTLLLPLATAIPQILFNEKTVPAWSTVGAAFWGQAGADKAEDAIPFIGEVLEILDILGDIATLAEISSESASAPWVIENEVSLTYPATITVSYDPNQASSFPRTATSYRLEAKVDGAAVLSPVTGNVNEGGQIRTAPLPVNVTAPFGGSQIVWSIVLLDAAGNQVGTGVSAPFTNNDPTDPPAAVPITFSQIAVPITATTRFTRDDTTGWNSATGGWTWSDAITVDGTQADAGVQQVAGVAVSTLAGAAAVVWEQGDEFYLRGVPTGQDGASIQLGPATAQGWARRPFLLLDPFTTKTSRGNHVLLDPDPSTTAYHVRAVTLDPTTGAPAWDPTTSIGDFPLEVSAATLHSSGRVVTVNTDSGRIGTLLPASASIPPTASYTGGAGVQIGLLDSPTAVAVTNPGTVLVLEPGAPQLSAFDLNGHPVTYFGSGGSAATEYRLALTKGRTYLDLAVDGANQIYLLFYTGDGSETTDYGVDVLEPQGTVLSTGSTGVNVPHLAVDYWRSIYAGDYDALADTQTGAPHTDPALGVVEPSLSVFDPVNPTDTRSRR